MCSLQVFEKDILQQKKRNFYIEGLFHAYQGLFMYLEWKELKEHAEALDKQEDAEGLREPSSCSSVGSVKDLTLSQTTNFRLVQT